MSQTYVHTCTNCTSRNYKCNSYNFWLNKYMNSSYLGIRRIKKIRPFLQKRHIQPRGSFTYTLYTPHLDIYPSCTLYSDMIYSPKHIHLSYHTHLHTHTTHTKPYTSTLQMHNTDTTDTHTLPIHMTHTTYPHMHHITFTSTYHLYHLLSHFLLLNMYVTHSTHTPHT